MAEPMITHRPSGAPRSTYAEPLAYRAEEVPRVFPLSRSVLFQKIKTGEIESFLVGRARFVPRESLIRFMERRLSEARAQAEAVKAFSRSEQRGGEVA